MEGEHDEKSAARVSEPVNTPVPRHNPSRRSAPRRTFTILAAALAAILLVALALAIWAWSLTRSLPARTAQPSPARTATPTPIPTLPAVSGELLVCQRQVARAMNARRMVGAANLAADRELRLRWVSLDWAVDALDDALPGVVQGLDAALEVWQEGCAVYDRVEMEVYDRRSIADRDRIAGGGRAEERQVLRLTVRAKIDDLLQWRAGEIGDRELLERLEVIRAGEN